MQGTAAGVDQTHTFVWLMSDPIQHSNIQIGMYGTEGCWCSCQAASLAGVSIALSKVNPLVICFTAAPSPSKHRASHQVNQLLSDMNRRAERSHMTTSSIISDASLSLREKGTLSPSPAACIFPPLNSCQVTHLPAMCNSVWDFKKKR